MTITVTVTVTVTMTITVCVTVTMTTRIPNLSWLSAGQLDGMNDEVREGWGEVVAAGDSNDDDNEDVSDDSCSR